MSIVASFACEWGFFDCLIVDYSTLGGDEEKLEPLKSGKRPIEWLERIIRKGKTMNQYTLKAYPEGQSRKVYRVITISYLRSREQWAASHEYQAGSFRTQKRAEVRFSLRFWR